MDLEAVHTLHIVEDLPQVVEGPFRPSDPVVDILDRARC